MRVQPAVEFGTGIGVQPHAVGFRAQRLRRHVHAIARDRAYPGRQGAQVAFEQGQPVLILRIQLHRGAVGAQRALLQLDVERRGRRPIEQQAAGFQGDVIAAAGVAGRPQILRVQPRRGEWQDEQKQQSRQAHGDSRKMDSPSDSRRCRNRR